MKKISLLFSITLLLGIGSLTFFQNRASDVSSVTGANEVHPRSGSDSIAAVAAVQKPELVAEEEKNSVPDADERRVIEPRTWGADNRSGKHLDNIPYGVGRVDEVLFEKIVPDEQGLVRRTRVLQTDFHFPKVQTVEILENDSATGEGTIVGYMAMVADHVMVQIDLERSPAGWEEHLSGNGIGVRRAVTKDGLYLMEFSVQEAGDAFEIIDSLRNDFDWVRFAEPDFLITSLNQHEVPAPLPNDPSFPEMWGLENTGQLGGFAGRDINAREGWRIRTDASSVIVAVLDTGVDFNHPDLRANMWVNPQETANGLDDSGSGFIDDIHGVDLVTGGAPNDFNGHGTHVAGTIGAVGNNGLGISGVAWDVQLMAVKILSPGGALSDIVRGIDYSWENGAHILNNSWGIILYGARLSGNWRSEALADSILRTRNAGAIFVAASGNDAVDVDIHPDFPAGHQSQSDNVVNVAALDRRGDLAFFSNYGVNNVQVAAPGHEILSTIPGGGYAEFSGTSMAAPHVAGMLALIKAEYPNDSHQVLIQRLYQRSFRDPNLTNYVQGGRRVDLGAALNPSPLIYAPVVNTSFRPGVDESVTLAAGVSGKGALSFKWFKNGEEVLGATGPALTFVSPGSGVAGYYRVEVSNSYGVASSEARLRAAVGNADLSAVLGDPGLSWFTSGDAPWVVSGAEAQSGAIAHNESSEIRTRVAGPGTLTFSWRVSSELNYDKLQFLIGDQVAKTISGESGPLLNRTFNIPAGEVDLVWRYSKDGGRIGGSDAGWLSDVTYDSNHPVVDSVTPSGLVAEGSTMTLSVAARGPALTYSWKRDGELLSNETGPDLILYDVSNVDAGSYVVTVANSFGVVSRTISLEVVAEAIAPIIFHHAQSMASAEGEQVVLWSDFDATSPWNIQWYKDGKAIAGADQTHLNLGGLTAEKTGSYFYSVTNAVGSDESLSMLVKLAPPFESFSSWMGRFGGRESVEQAIKDGIDPLIRFALGVAPNESVANRLPKVAIVPGPEVFTASGNESNSAGDYMALVFERPAMIGGVVYGLEVSSDLITWSEVESMVEVLDLPGGDTQLVVLREASELPAEETRRFLRLKVGLSD